MTAIPTYLYFGDVMITGGAQPDTQLPTLWGQFLNNPRFSRVVPSGPDGYTGGTFEPYWDGSVNGGVGAFVRYHYVNGLVVAGARGDNWSTNGGGITPCTMLMNALWARHPSGFKLLKYAVSTAGWSQWKPGGAAWNAALAEWNKMVAAAAATGDTLDLRACIVDCSATDIVGGSTTYAADAQAFVSGFRATYGPTALLTIVSHRADFHLPTPGAAFTARALHQSLAIANPRVSVFDMNWAEFGSDGTTGGTTIGPNNDVYETIDYVDAGQRLGRHLELHLADAAPPPKELPGAGIATHVLLGDSNMMTAFLDPRIVARSEQASLLGESGRTVRDGQYLWDAQNREVVPYDVLGTTNSLGSTEKVFGPECTYLKRMHEATPNGVVVFKYAQGGAALTSALFAGVWGTIQKSWKEFTLAVARDLGRSVDCRGITIMLGRNDAYVDASANAFAARAATFVDQCREVFTTRTDGPPLAVVWVQPSPHADSVLGGSTPGAASALEHVRRSIADLPSRRARVSVLLDPDAKYELRRDDRLHYGAEAILQIGYDAAHAILAMNEASA